MQINADFTRRVLVHPGSLPWIDSPLPGVRRRMLDRIGDEVARATSIVEYAPGSSFSAHVHGGGEEFLVLSGVFQDEQGNYPVGTYVRNPPQSSHTPRSDTGCTLLVKLWQFDPLDRTPIRFDTTNAIFHIDASNHSVQKLPLYKDVDETVEIERWAPETALTLKAPRGLELFVLSGSLRIANQPDEQVLREHAWLRLPPGDRIDLHSGADGVRFWIKRDHLLNPKGLSG